MRSLLEDLVILSGIPYGTFLRIWLSWFSVQNKETRALVPKLGGHQHGGHYCHIIVPRLVQGFRGLGALQVVG